MGFAEWAQASPGGYRSRGYPMEKVRSLFGSGGISVVTVILTGSLLTGGARSQESDFVGRAD